MTNAETIEVLKALRGLSPDKIVEVRDFALFLRDKYTDETYSDFWTDEDIADFASASSSYFDEVVGEEASS